MFTWSRNIPVIVLAFGLLLSNSLTVSAAEKDVELEWAPNQEEDLAGYNVYHGTASGVYGFPDNVNNKTSHRKEDLDSTKKHYFAVTAYDEAGNESSPSAEVSTQAENVLHTLSVSISGNGTVSSAPAGIGCTSSCNSSFTEGQSVTLSATPKSNWKFSSWGGACSGSGSCVVTMNAAKSVTIKFVESTKPQHNLSVSISGNGSVSSAPAGINCTSSCNSSFTEGQSVTLAATPKSGSTFSKWNGACTGSGSCVVTMSAAKSVTATFVATSNPPTNPPTGGTVVSINFQPSSSSTPSGFIKDDGSQYSSSRGYGWSTRVNTRERKAHKDQSRDTFIHFDRGTSATWSYDLPNGKYFISLASGDPSYRQGPHHVVVEGQTVINNVTTQVNQFKTVTNSSVTVSDGQLNIRLTRSGGSQKTILNYVRIAPADPNTVPVPPPSIPPTGGSAVSINFQPSSSSTPSGFIKDDGSPYSSSRGYGWSTRVNTRERKAHKDQSRDTFIHFDRGTSATWSYNLPNGKYVISLASGDPSYRQGPHHVVVEGQTVINNVTTQVNQFKTVTNFPVTVSDGQLNIRLTRSGGSQKTILNYVRIAPEGSNPGSVPPTGGTPSGGEAVSINFQPSSASIPKGFIKDDGSPYSSSRGYGWSTRVNTRERFFLGDQSRDTLIHFDQGSTATWQYDLANGNYLVSLASGDPSYAQGPHHITVEGKPVIQNVRTRVNEFLTITDFPVTVSDGKLTVNLQRQGQHVILNYIMITPAP